MRIDSGCCGSAVLSEARGTLDEPTDLSLPTGRDLFGARARGETCGAPAFSLRCARGVPAGPARGYACWAGRAARAHPQAIAASAAPAVPPHGARSSCLGRASGSTRAALEALVRHLNRPAPCRSSRLPSVVSRVVVGCDEGLPVAGPKAEDDDDSEGCVSP